MSLQSVAAGFAKAAIRLCPGVPVTYRLFVGTTFDPVAGTNVDQYMDVLIPYAAQRSIDIREVTPGGVGPLQVGDVSWVFPRADLGDSVEVAKSQDVSTSDLLVAAGVTYRVIAPTVKAHGTILEVIGRRVTR